MEYFCLPRDSIAQYSAVVIFSSHIFTLTFWRCLGLYVVGYKKIQQNIESIYNSESTRIAITLCQFYYTCGLVIALPFTTIPTYGLPQNLENNIFQILR